MAASSSGPTMHLVFARINKAACLFFSINALFSGDKTGIGAAVDEDGVFCGVVGFSKPVPATTVKESGFALACGWHAT